MFQGRQEHRQGGAAQAGGPHPGTPHPVLHHPPAPLLPGSTAKARLETLLHELFHISLRFDGTLHAGRRHAKLGADFGRRLRPLVRRYLKVCPEALLAALAHSGEVRVLQWLERPGPAYHPRASHRRVRKVYTEEQLYSGVARMVTPRPRMAREANVRDNKMH